MIWSSRLLTAEGHTLSLFRVAVFLTTAGSMSKPISEFTTYAPRTGEIGLLTRHFATNSTFRNHQDTAGGMFNQINVSKS